MKFCIALLCLFAVIITAHAHHDDYRIKTKEDLGRYRDECVKKLNIPNDLLEKYKKWEYPDDEKTRCYLKCIFEHFELYDEAKGFDVHRIHHQLAGDSVDHSDDLHGKIENCVKKGADEADQCTRAYRAITCFFKENLSLVKQSVASK